MHAINALRVIPFTPRPEIDLTEQQVADLRTAVAVALTTGEPVPALTFAAKVEGSALLHALTGAAHALGMPVVFYPREAIAARPERGTVGQRGHQEAIPASPAVVMVRRVEVAADALREGAYEDGGARLVRG